MSAGDSYVPVDICVVCGEFLEAYGSCMPCPAKPGMRTPHTGIGKARLDRFAGYLVQVRGLDPGFIRVGNTLADVKEEFQAYTKWKNAGAGTSQFTYRVQYHWDPPAPEDPIEAALDMMEET